MGLDHGVLGLYSRLGVEDAHAVATLSQGQDRHI